MLTTTRTAQGKSLIGAIYNPHRLHICANTHTNTSWMDEEHSGETPWWYLPPAPEHVTYNQTTRGGYSGPGVTQQQYSTVYQPETGYTGHQPEVVTSEQGLKLNPRTVTISTGKPATNTQSTFPTHISLAQQLTVKLHETSTPQTQIDDSTNFNPTPSPMMTIPTSRAAPRLNRQTARRFLCLTSHTGYKHFIDSCISLATSHNLPFHRKNWDDNHKSVFRHGIFHCLPAPSQDYLRALVQGRFVEEGREAARCLSWLASEAMRDRCGRAEARSSNERAGNAVRMASGALTAPTTNGNGDQSEPNSPNRMTNPTGPGHSTIRHGESNKTNVPIQSHLTSGSMAVNYLDIRMNTGSDVDMTPMPMSFQNTVGVTNSIPGSSTHRMDLVDHQNGLIPTSGRTARSRNTLNHQKVGFVARPPLSPTTNTTSPRHCPESNWTVPSYGQQLLAAQIQPAIIDQPTSASQRTTTTDQNPPSTSMLPTTEILAPALVAYDILDRATFTPSTPTEGEVAGAVASVVPADMTGSLGEYGELKKNLGRIYMHVVVHESLRCAGIREMQRYVQRWVLGSMGGVDV